MLVTLSGLKSFDHHSLISVCINKVFDENTKRVHLTFLKKPKWSCTCMGASEDGSTSVNTLLAYVAGAG